MVEIEDYRQNMNEDDDEEESGTKEEGSEVIDDMGIQTYVEGNYDSLQEFGNIKNVKAEGEEVDIGSCRTLVLISNDNVPAATTEEEEPMFMKYIKNMNVNYVNNEYL